MLFMDYFEVRFYIEPFEEYIYDVLAAELGELGFDSFATTEETLDAYIPEIQFDESKLKTMLDDFPFEANIEFKYSKIESKNWNEEWEKHYFEPIVIGNDCVIHSSFHQNVPQAKYDIVIDPKMAFGTGHHETTSLVIAEILKMNLQDKMMLDMGCGTAVLAILASMRGAKNILVLANINRNILLADMESYAACLESGGELYMSGFYTEDIPIIEAEANRNGLKLTRFQEKNNWVVVHTIKE